MKLLTFLLFLTLSSCQGLFVPDFSRGIIDESILQEKPGIIYTQSKKEYIFEAVLPKLNKGKISDYNWYCKWTCLTKIKGGVYTKLGDKVKVTPIDMLSVYIDVYCVHKITGIKSKTVTNNKIIKI